MKPERVEHEILLLVEGKDACNFFDTFRERLELADVGVRDFGGVGQLRTYLPALVSASGFQNVRRLGIIRDAETSEDPARTAERAFQSMRSALDNAGLPAPARQAQFTDPDAGRPEVAVLILPGGDQEGMLETLLCKTFAGTAVDRCIVDFLRCVEESNEPVRRPDKARAHAYLATKPDPHVSVGVAARKGYWDLDHAALDSVRGFLALLNQVWVRGESDRRVQRAVG